MDYLLGAGSAHCHLPSLVLYVLTCNLRRLEETSAVLLDLILEDSLKRGAFFRFVKLRHFDEGHWRKSRVLTNPNQHPLSEEAIYLNRAAKS